MNEDEHAQPKQTGFPVEIERRLGYFFQHLRELAPVLQGAHWTKELGEELLTEIERVRKATEKVARDTSPDPSNTEVTAEDVRRWEREVGPAQERTALRAWTRMSPELREALKGDFLNFVQAHNAHCKLSGDVRRLDSERPLQALGIEYMDRAAAESVRRLRGTAEAGLAADQYTRAAASRERRGKEPPDFWTMLELLKRAATDLEDGRSPPANCSPRSVLVTSPPAMSQEGYLPRESIDVRADPDSPSLADELPSEAREAVEAMEAAEAAAVLRELKPLVRKLAAERAAERARGKYQDMARRSLAPLALRELKATDVARLEGVPEKSWPDVRKAVRNEVAQIHQDPAVRALARRAGF